MALENRKAFKNRRSNETQISVSINLDGEGNTQIKTGIGMFDHMLTLLAFWANINLEIHCKGDLEIDAHHSMEDVGLVLGQAFFDALGNRAGIKRIGFGRVPMDDSLSEVSVDLSGRPWLEWRGDELLPPVIAREEKDVWREFYKAFSNSGKFNLHVLLLYGKNGHHLLESVAKSTGQALKEAVARERTQTIKSTKGGLD